MKSKQHSSSKNQSFIESIYEAEDEHGVTVGSVKKVSEPKKQLRNI
jgi:hypothetical protein